MTLTLLVPRGAPGCEDNSLRRTMAMDAASFGAFGFCASPFCASLRTTWTKDTVCPLGSRAIWPSDPPTGLVRPKRLGGYKKIKKRWPLLIGRCMDHAPAHS